MKLTVSILLIPLGALAGALIGAYFAGSLGSTIGSLLGLIPGTAVSMVSALRDHEQRQADKALIADLQHRTDPAVLWDEKVAWESRLTSQQKAAPSSRYHGQR